ncbi:MAG: class I SAM-dependent methyltransferase [Flavobacteriales bacterium]|nr:class I SAM-dependent methyltransferase [Flavobacteriales bacterium]
MKRIYSSHWSDYELIDAGNDKKIERFGNTILIRPDRNAYFSPILSQKEWKQKAHFEFIEETSSKGIWKTLKQNTPKEWQINYKGCVFNLRLTKFKHIGVFPEQQSNWDFIKTQLCCTEPFEEKKFLNLFAYTGGASLIANSAGANVFHCDSVKQIISWSKENMESSNQSDIRWVFDDALKFATKEVKGKKNMMV